MQQHLEFLNNKNPELVKLTESEPGNLSQGDLRQAVIYYLRQGGR